MGDVVGVGVVMVVLLDNSPAIVNGTKVPARPSLRPAGIRSKPRFVDSEAGPEVFTNKRMERDPV